VSAGGGIGRGDRWAGIWAGRRPEVGRGAGGGP